MGDGISIGGIEVSVGMDARNLTRSFPQIGGGESSGLGIEGSDLLQGVRHSLLGQTSFSSLFEQSFSNSSEWGMDYYDRIPSITPFFDDIQEHSFNNYSQLDSSDFFGVSGPVDQFDSNLSAVTRRGNSVDVIRDDLIIDAQQALLEWKTTGQHHLDLGTFFINTELAGLS